MFMNILPSLFLLTILYFSIFIIIILINFFKVIKFNNLKKILLIITLIFVLIIIFLGIYSLSDSISNNYNDIKEGFNVEFEYVIDYS